MKTIKSYSTSPIYIISIRYNGELIRFNLEKELRLLIDSPNPNLKSQPSKYGFCLLVHKKLVTRWEELKAQRKRTYGRLFFKAKAKKINGRLMSDDLCKQWVEKHDDYFNITNKCIKAKDEADQLFSCIRAFEQRKDVLQTISSNTRSEKIS